MMYDICVCMLVLIWYLIFIYPLRHSILSLGSRVDYQYAISLVERVFVDGIIE